MRGIVLVLIIEKTTKVIPKRWISQRTRLLGVTVIWFEIKSFGVTSCVSWP